MPVALTAAFEMHQAGQLGSAAQLYQEVLTQEQENPDALHLLGVLHHQKEEHTRAVELIGRAVALRPNAAVFHANLAEVYRALGQFDRAAGCCRTALRLRPDYPEALCNLGLALQGLGQHTESATLYRRALRLRPDFATVHNNLGNVLRELGHFDEALTHFQHAVEVEPGFALAHTNLGQMLLDAGRAEEALPHCQEAVRLRPDLAATHHNLGNVLRAQGRLVEARAAYLDALRLQPDLAQTHANLGLTLQQEGQLEAAHPWLEQAVELAPQDARLWGHLAALHADREEPGDAIPCYERMLQLEPTCAATCNALGWALQEEGRLANAAERFRAAIRLEPDYPAAHLNLGGLQEELGDFTEAEKCFRESLRLQPRYAAALARLATLLRGKVLDADLAAVVGRLADETLPDGPRANLLFGLAQVHDARGDYARAADCLHQANALTLAEAARRHRVYIPAEHDRFVEGVRAAFTRDWFQRIAAGGRDARRPVFVFGLPRSGTTLIEQVLASHSRVHAAGELRLTRQSFLAIPGVLGRSDWPLSCVPHLTPTAVRHLADQHLAKLGALDGGRAERVVDKMPDNYLYLGLIAAMFPHAVLIHCRRDSRDVAVSCWMTDFRSIRWANDIEHIASRFCQHSRVMEHWREVLPLSIHEVRYEETVADVEGVARRVLAACGLEWEPACLEFYQTRRPVRTASVTQVRQPLYTHSVARWKHYETALRNLFDRLPSG
jgi:tetratricopeptide (TPR) repeat protein